MHSIDLRFNGRHVPGSPFNIRVGEQGQAGDPGLVTAYGPGLEGGVTGDTRGERWCGGTGDVATGWWPWSWPRSWLMLWPWMVVMKMWPCAWEHGHGHRDMALRWWQ